MEYDVEDDLITVKPHRNINEKWDMRINTAQQTKCRSTRDKVPTTEAFTVGQTTVAFCREATSEVRLSGLILHVDHNGFQDRISRIYEVFHEAVPVSLRERILHASNNQNLLDNQVSDAWTTHFEWYQSAAHGERCRSVGKQLGNMRI